MSEGWLSAHLFHYGDLDALIEAVVEPVVLRCAVRGHFFLRYWEGGQHLRLRVRVADPCEAARIRGLIAGLAADHFARHPSTTAVDAGAYRAFAASAARGERRAVYDTRLREPDTVEFVAYRPEYDVYGDAACIAAVERHFTDASELALQVLRIPMEQRAAVGLAVLTLTLAACEPDLDAAAARFAAGWRHPGPDGDHRALLSQTRRLWDPACAAFSSWSTSVRQLRDSLEDLRAAGRCAPVDSGSPHAHLAMIVPPARRTVPLILLRCAHLFHNRIGLRAGAELHLSLLAARALADLRR
ncbi:lantibiotic dehydratase C-terminal domain-containing protein [Nonomuraea sp. NPDC050663]|uniref:lantibiotic dehydratase C-terminal domain-containing protein n=1 Tax=Nonomuraea sp. NPDC050663 TaxID=3364370 RepID=UPI0037965DB6